MVKVDILGSCVTRDVFEFDETNIFSVNKYFARSSLASIYSLPLKINGDQIGLDSNFQRRMVLQDISKEFKRYIKSIQSDLFIIDFIDERFSILRTPGGRFITRSTEFLKSNLPYEVQTGSVNDEQKLNLWEKAAENLISDLKNHYDPSKLVLHKAFWKKTYVDKSGNHRYFDDETTQLIQRHNEKLSYLYDFIESNLSSAQVIQLEGFVASENHRWGLQPFHYEDAYYQEFLISLNRILDKQRGKTKIEKLTEKDFEGAPTTVESDGFYRFIIVNGEAYFLNVDTGEITQ